MSLDGQRICGHKHRIVSPSLPYNPKEQGLAAVNSAQQRGRSTEKKRRSRSDDEETRKETSRSRRGRRRRRRAQVSGGGERSRLQSPVSEWRGSQEGRSGRRERISQSLPRDAIGEHKDSDTGKGTVRGRKSEGDRGRSGGKGIKSRSEERGRVVKHSEESEQEEEQETPAAEEWVEEKVEERGALEENVEEDVFLPIPSLTVRLPRPKQRQGVVADENWDVTAEYRGLKADNQLESKQETVWDDEKASDLNESDAQSMRPLPGVDVIEPVSQRKLFSLFTSAASVEQRGDDESESGSSQSDGSVSAATISGRSLAGRRWRAVMLPGPWLTPRKQRLVQVVQENGRPKSRTDQRGRHSVSFE